MELKSKMIFPQGKKKKIMLQGYLHDANFGDILMAYLFYKRCQNNEFTEIDFFQYKDLGIGSFCRSQIGYKIEKNVLSCFRADAFVIISGGSFWNDGNILSDAKIRYRRFILPALIYQTLGKPVYVLGVGGGHVDTIWLRRKMIKLLNRARKITFRDEHTKQVFVEYGVNNEMIVSADTALVLKEEIDYAMQGGAIFNKGKITVNAIDKNIEFAGKTITVINKKSEDQIRAVVDMTIPFSNSLSRDVKVLEVLKTNPGYYKAIKELLDNID